MRKYKKIAALSLFGAMVLGYNNCGQVQFSPAQSSNAAAGIGPTSCNPFGGVTTPGQGLLAKGIYYVEQSQLPAGEDPDTVISNSVLNFFTPNPLIGVNNINIVLPYINFPAMYFSQGFSDGSGTAVTDSAGNVLTSYFGFSATSTFVPGSLPPGDYQIASLTDDGSVLTIKGGQANGSDFVISNDGTHSMQMGCTTSLLHVTANSSYPLTFDYFQGPPITIGLMLMYRPVPTGNTQDSLCGKGAQSDSYFFLDHDANNNPITSIPQAPYNQLLADGWQPLEGSNYQLPASAQTACPQ